MCVVAKGRHLLFACNCNVVAVTLHVVACRPNCNNICYMLNALDAVVELITTIEHVVVSSNDICSVIA